MVVVVVAAPTSFRWSRVVVLTTDHGRVEVGEGDSKNPGMKGEGGKGATISSAAAWGIL